MKISKLNVKQLILSAVLLFIYSGSTYAQSLVFPNSWLGTWSGEVAIVSHKGIKKPVTMTLEVALTMQKDTINWIITYADSVKTDVRSYLLIRTDSSSFHYILDEQNSILLEMDLLGNTFYSTFEVSGNLLTVLYTLLDEDTISSQIIVNNSEQTISSGNTSDDIPEVKAFPLRSIQSAVLKKNKPK